MLRAVGRTYREAFTGLGRRVWILALVTFINRSGTMVLPFLTLYLTTQKNETATQAGAALSLYGLGAIAGSYLGGWLCDRLGAVAVQGVSLATTGVLFLVLGQVESRPAILGVLLLLSLSNEIFRPANATSFAQASEPSNRARAFAVNRLAVNLGMSIGPVVGGVLATVDYSWLFVIDAVTCLAAAVLLISTFGLSRRRLGESAVGHAAAADSAWQDRPYLIMLLLNTLLACVFFQLMSTFPLTLRQAHGFTEDRIGLVYAVNTVIIVAIEMALVHSLSDRNPLRVMAVGAVLVGGGLALLPFGRGFAYVTGTVVVWTFGEILTMPFGGALAANRAGPRRQGQYMGLYTLSFSVAFVAAPIAGTWVYQHVSPTALWLACGGLGVVIAAALLALARRLEAAPAGAIRE
ncbi:MAG: MFS transporter [Planctomycetes bacterium]|nr:MFS transporter [Planctomycetota bacterium]